VVGSYWEARRSAPPPERSSILGLPHGDEVAVGESDSTFSSLAVVDGPEAGRLI